MILFICKCVQYCNIYLVYCYFFKLFLNCLFVSNRHGTGISVWCMMPYDEYRQFTPNPEGGARSNATLFDNLQQKNQTLLNANGDTEVATLMFGSLYFILIKYQLAVKLAMLELMCVCACACT